MKMTKKLYNSIGVVGIVIGVAFDIWLFIEHTTVWLWKTAIGLVCFLLGALLAKAEVQADNDFRAARNITD